MNTPTFVPLDIPIEIDKAEIISYLDQHAEPFSKWWASSIIRRRKGQKFLFETQMESRLDFLNRYETETDWVWHPDFERKFPQLIKAFNSLPFSHLTHCHLLSQSIDVEPHRDLPNNRTMGIRDSEAEKFNELKGNYALEPVLYKVMLGDIPENNFYVCSNGKGQNKEFVKFPPGVRFFIVPENFYYHGAIPAPGTQKVVCSFYGFLDPKRHKELLQCSLEKFKDFVCWGEKPEKPLPYFNDYIESGIVRNPEPRDEFQPIPIYKQNLRE